MKVNLKCITCDYTDVCNCELFDINRLECLPQITRIWNRHMKRTAIPHESNFNFKILISSPKQTKKSIHVTEQKLKLI